MLVVVTMCPLSMVLFACLGTLVPALVFRFGATSQYRPGSGYEEHKQYGKGSAYLTPLAFQITTVFGEHTTILLRVANS